MILLFPFESISKLSHQLRIRTTHHCFLFSGRQLWLGQALDFFFSQHEFLGNSSFLKCIIWVVSQHEGHRCLFGISSSTSGPSHICLLSAERIICVTYLVLFISSVVLCFVPLVAVLCFPDYLWSFLALAWIWRNKHFFLVFTYLLCHGKHCHSLCLESLGGHLAGSAGDLGDGLGWPGLVLWLACRWWILFLGIGLVP